MAETAPGEEKGFAADDARLSAMHGYAALRAQADDSALRDREDVVARQDRLEGKVEALEVLVRGLIAGKGPVAPWTP